LNVSIVNSFQANKSQKTIPHAFLFAEENGKAILPLVYECKPSQSDHFVLPVSVVRLKPGFMWVRLMIIHSRFVVVGVLLCPQRHLWLLWAFVAVFVTGTAAISTLNKCEQIVRLGMVVKVAKHWNRSRYTNTISYQPFNECRVFKIGKWLL
jgi:hypothetical protein